MITQVTKNKYCFDTSAFVDSWRRYYRPNVFRELWERIGARIEDGSILIPEEVKKEIGVSKDDLGSWFKRYHPYIVPVSVDQIRIVSAIVNKYPLVSQYKKPRPYHADPFLVALAKTSEQKVTVVTYESRNRSNDHPRIPDLCIEYGVDWCPMVEFFEREGWQFRL